MASGELQGCGRNLGGVSSLLVQHTNPVPYGLMSFSFASVIFQHTVLKSRIQEQLLEKMPGAYPAPGVSHYAPLNSKLK